MPTFLGREVPCSDETKTWNPYLMEFHLFSIFMGNRFSLSATYRLRISVYFFEQVESRNLRSSSSSSMIYNYMKKRSVVVSSKMRTACVAALKKGRSPIAKRTMSKLRQPSRIGS